MPWRGYHLARIDFNASADRILMGADAGIIAPSEDSNCCLELFAHSATAGPLKAKDLVGCRGECSSGLDRPRHWLTEVCNPLDALSAR